MCDSRLQSCPPENLGTEARSSRQTLRLKDSSLFAQTVLAH